MRRDWPELSWGVKLHRVRDPPPKEGAIYTISSLINSSFQHVLVECLPCARHWSRLWGRSQGTRQTKISLTVSREKVIEVVLSVKRKSEAGEGGVECRPVSYRVAVEGLGGNMLPARCRDGGAAGA